jgi:hypothetical protein
METVIKSVRVFDVIVDIQHQRANDYTDIGTIFYREINDNGINPVITSNLNTDTAKPLFSFIKKYPLKGEITTVLTSQGKDSPVQAENYYLPPLNIWNHPHHGAFIHTEEILDEDFLGKYGDAQSGLIRKSLKSKGITLK